LLIAAPFLNHWKLFWPLKARLNVTLEPTGDVWLTGWVVITGASGAVPDVTILKPVRAL
jgi:hypothetical protein